MSISFLKDLAKVYETIEHTNQRLVSLHLPVFDLQYEFGN